MKRTIEDSKRQDAAMVIQYYFNKFKFNKLKQEEEDEDNFARTCMDSEYWCWNCKYSDCEIH